MWLQSTHQIAPATTLPVGWVCYPFSIEDTLTRLQSHGDVWLASASPNSISMFPYNYDLVMVSTLHLAYRDHLIIGYLGLSIRSFTCQFDSHTPHDCDWRDRQLPLWILQSTPLLLPMRKEGLSGDVLLLNGHPFLSVIIDVCRWLLPFSSRPCKRLHCLDWRWTVCQQRLG